MSERLKNQSIYGDEPKGKLAAADHNVGRRVLNDSDKPTRTLVQKKYGMRAGHIPNNEIVAVVVEKVDGETKGHLDYVSEITGKNVYGVTQDELKNLPTSTLVVPYTNTSAANKELNEQMNQPRIWGLPPKLVDIMADKAFTNVDILNKYKAGQTNLMVPELVVVIEQDMIQKGVQFYKETTEQYAKLDPAHHIDLVIRFAQSDGGYGNAFIQRAGVKLQVSINGAEETTTFKGMHSALTFAHGKLKENMSDETDNHEVVISRAVDVESSPGLSVLVVDGEFYSLGWNDQIMTPNGKACIGTKGYEQNGKRDLEDRSAEYIISYVSELAEEQGVDLSAANGVFNADLIIPGPEECELLRKRGIDPTTALYFIEINPRWTNRTDAVALAAHISKIQHTYNGFMQTSKLGVTALDKFPHGYKSVSELRESIQEQDYLLQKEKGERIMLRMGSVGTAGIIYIGDFEKNGKEVLRKIG